MIRISILSKESGKQDIYIVKRTASCRENVDVVSSSPTSIYYVTVEGRNQTLLMLSTFEKKSRKFYYKGSVTTKVKFD